MASRPIFVPRLGSVGVEELMLNFNWHPGMSKKQKQRSIQELHRAAESYGFAPTLEISSKSEEETGIRLSAFNLTITTKLKKCIFTVETAFQGSKVYERGGPYADLIGMDSRAAKKDIRHKESGNLIGFEFFGDRFPLVPRTYFYDWLYINALHQHDDLTEAVKSYVCFSDIEFNPAKSINCQAHSVALYLSLFYNKLLDQALISPSAFLEVTKAQYESQKRNVNVQGKII